MRISDWSSDVCSSDLVLSQDEAAQARREGLEAAEHAVGELPARGVGPAPLQMIGRVLHDDGHDVARVLHQRRVGETRDDDLERSEERRAGTECVRTCRSRGSQYT